MMYIYEAPEAEIFAKSCEIRFVEYPNGRKILQQAWIGNRESVKWVNVPMVWHTEASEDA